MKAFFGKNVSSLDPTTPQPMTWKMFWPRVTELVRKSDESKGNPAISQAMRMKFAGSLKRKAYAEWTDSEILNEYAVWIPPAEEPVASKKEKAVPKNKEKPVAPEKEKAEKKNKKRPAVKEEPEDAEYPPVPPAPQLNSPVKADIQPAARTHLPLPPSPAETDQEAPKEPVHIRRKNIPKHIKTLVWNKYIGSEVAISKCMSCREVRIENTSFHCGHVIAESKGGNMTINNLRPICAHCNLSMGTKSMNEFTKEFFGWTV